MAAGDGGIDQSVLVALIGTTGLLGAAMIAGVTAMWRTAKSVGTKNGHGSLQDSLAVIHQRLDDDDRDRARGQLAQIELVEAVNEVRALCEANVEAIKATEVSVKATQVTLDGHTLLDEESFQTLRAGTDRLESLLGSPRPGDTHAPVIPYLHEAIHNLNEQLVVIRETPHAQTGLLQRALDLLAHYDQRLQGQTP